MTYILSYVTLIEECTQRTVQYANDLNHKLKRNLLQYFGKYGRVSTVLTLIRDYCHIIWVLQDRKVILVRLEVSGRVNYISIPKPINLVPFIRSQMNCEQN